MEMRGLEAYQEQGGSLRYTPERVMELDGHQVAWVSYAWQGEEEEIAGHSLLCECDFLGECTESGGWLKSGNSFHCVYAEAARLIRCREVADQLDASRPRDQQLSSLGWGTNAEERIQQLLRELLSRAEAGEWIGQRDGTLYLQTIEQISGVPHSRLRECADKLRRRGEMGLSGSIITSWSEAHAPRDDPDHGLDDQIPPAGEPIPCVLEFFSETGSEGGMWACHDRSKLEWKPAQGPFWPGQPVRLAEDDSPAEIAEKEGKAGVSEGESSLRVRLQDGSEREVQAEELLVVKNGYAGLHILRSGDWLEISSANGEEILWQGYVRLRHYPLFTEAASGMWIHSDQRGLPRERWALWFFKGLSARLIPCVSPPESAC